MKNSLSISDASVETGLTQKQLREYETKGFIREPFKVRCGAISYRRYTPEHIKEIKIFAKYKNQGFMLPMAASKAKEGLMTTDNIIFLPARFRYSF